MVSLSSHDKQTLTWVESLRIPSEPYGRYKMSNNTGASPFTSCFACFIRNMLHDLDSLTNEQRSQWIDYLQSYQDPQTGLFSFHMDDNEKHIHDDFYRDLQLTSFMLPALDTLGAVPLHPIHFLTQHNLNKPEVFEQWMAGQLWHRPWHAGNMVMFLGIILLYLVDREIDPQFSDSANAFFDWHDKTQNHRTGFWGNGKESEYHFGLYGAYHQYTLYFYRNRKINYAEAIIDRALSFQNVDGFYCHEMGGGGCEDIDVIDPLVQLSFRTKYRHSDIKNSLLWAYDSILSLQLPSGGYVWGRKERSGLKPALQTLFSLPHLNWDLYHWYFRNKRFWRQQLSMPTARRANGWTDGSIPFTESDLFATWFRLCALGAIARAFPNETKEKHEYAFIKAPGLGWFPDAN